MQTKVCTKCKHDLPMTLEYFGPCKRNKNGFRSWCRNCSNVAKKDYLRVLSKEKRIKMLQTKKDLNLKVKYGLTSVEKLQMCANQNGCCAICEQPIPYSNLYVDHNHKIGKVRGLLCYRCNPLLSAIEDENFNKRAREYLKNTA
jgi:hypothetical protein